MTTTSYELEQLKRKLLVQYKDDIARLSDPHPSHSPDGTEVEQGEAEGEEKFPTTAHLTLQLLCLREGRSLHDVPKSAREQVAMMARAMPTPDVLVEDRLRHAQNESVRLLVQRTAATLRNDASASSPGDQHENDGSGSAARPVTAAERLALLERMYASNMHALAGDEQSEMPAVGKA